jgi:nucleobase:cation symporter-1, NCS1 family
VVLNIPGFLNAAFPSLVGNPGGFFSTIYTYAWFVGLAVAAIVYRVLMLGHADPAPAVSPTA